MSIERKLISSSLRKGQVLIIAEGKSDYKTDAIVVYDSFCICNGVPKVLQEQGTLTNDVIYITGHGSKHKYIFFGEPVISGRTMEEIADMLVDNYSYTGTQDIEILSCYAKNDDAAKDMGKLLESALKKKLETKNSTLIGTVKALAEHTTVIYKRKVMDIDFGSIGFTFLQRKKLRKMGFKKMRVKEIGSFNHNKRKQVGKYNDWLMYGEGVDGFMEAEVWKFVISILSACICIAVVGCLLQYKYGNMLYIYGALILGVLVGILITWWTLRK